MTAPDATKIETDKPLPGAAYKAWLEVAEHMQEGHSYLCATQAEANALRRALLEEDAGSAVRPEGDGFRVWRVAKRRINRKPRAGKAAQV